jgi:hypothetical protein
MEFQMGAKLRPCLIVPAKTLLIAKNTKNYFINKVILLLNG